MLRNLATSAILGASKVQEHLTATLFPTVTPMTDSTPNVAYPGDTCCTFYADGFWGGDSKTLCATKEQTFKLDGFNDKTSSFYCGKSVAYDLCNDGVDKDCRGGNGMTGAGTVMSAQVGKNDHLSTVKMRPYDPTEQGAVLLFKDKDCRNDVGRFYAPVSNSEKMSYT